jgi:hypothetical protein
LASYREGKYEDEGGGDREREYGSMGTRVGNMRKGREHEDEVGEMGKGNIVGMGVGENWEMGNGNMRWGAWG